MCQKLASELSQPSDTGSSVPRAGIPPCFIVAGLDWVAIESQVLKVGGCLPRVSDYVKGS